MAGLLYFEPQRAALCGVHALNMLLQGPVFTEWDLSTVALGLDAKERQLMAEAGIHTSDFAAFAAEESGNVAADGNFSITVLEECLRIWSLACTPLASGAAASVRQAPERESAFLLNLEKHWYCLRRLGADWWRFNSLEAAPAPVSDTYLAILLAQLQQEGWSIHVVRGEWPARNSLYAAPSPYGRWLTREHAAEAHAEAARNRVEGRTRSAVSNALARVAGEGGTLTLRAPRDAYDQGDDDELRRALAASLGEDGAPAVAHSRGAAARQSMTEDEELARAIASSLEDEPAAKRHEPTRSAPAARKASHELPAEPAADAYGVLQLALRLPLGSRVARRFLPSDTLALVLALAESHGVDMATHRLASGFPPAELRAAGTATLAELKLEDKSCILVQPR